MNRRGLSLVEVLIAVVLLGIVGVGISRLLQSQLRFFARSSNARDARSVNRNAVNLMRNEMRMIEPRGITAAAADSIVVNVPYATGIYCALNTATFAPVDSLTWATAAFAGYVWRDTTAGATNAYQASGTAPTAGLAATCTAVSITTVPNGPVLILSPNVPTSTAGAPILLYQTVTYRFANSTLVSGRRALWRQVTGGASEEIAVPVDSSSRFRFYVNGGTTAQDGVPSPLNTMSGVEVVLEGESERTSPGTGAPESATTRLSIFFRNAVQ